MATPENVDALYDRVEGVFNTNRKKFRECYSRLSKEHPQLKEDLLELTTLKTTRGDKANKRLEAKGCLRDPLRKVGWNPVGMSLVGQAATKDPRVYRVCNMKSKDCSYLLVIVDAEDPIYQTLTKNKMVPEEADLIRCQKSDEVKTMAVVYPRPAFLMEFRDLPFVAGDIQRQINKIVQLFYRLAVEIGYEYTDPTVNTIGLEFNRAVLLDFNPERYTKIGGFASFFGFASANFKNMIKGYVSSLKKALNVRRYLDPSRSEWEELFYERVVEAFRRGAASFNSQIARDLDTELDDHLTDELEVKPLSV